MEGEARLVSRLKAGDRAAFAELVERHSPQVYHLALRMMQEPSEAEEILQETFVQAAKHIGSFRGDARLGTWLHRIATNQALMALRRRRPASVSLDIDEEGNAGTLAQLADWSQLPESELLDREARAQMERAIRALPDSLRAVFVLRDIEGLSTAEAAAALNLSVSAIKSRLLRARLRLRDRLSVYFGERVRAQGIHGDGM